MEGRQYQSTYSGNPERDWDAHCDNLELAALENPLPTADEILTTLIEDRDEFADAFSDMAAGYWTAHMRTSVKGQRQLSLCQQREHDRAAKLFDALAGLCAGNDKGLTPREAVIRATILESLTEVAQERENDQ